MKVRMQVNMLKNQVHNQEIIQDRLILEVSVNKSRMYWSEWKNLDRCFRSVQTVPSESDSQMIRSEPFEQKQEPNSQCSILICAKWKQRAVEARKKIRYGI